MAELRPSMGVLQAVCPGCAKAMPVVLRAAVVLLHVGSALQRWESSSTMTMVTAGQAGAIQTPRFLHELWVQERVGKIV